MNLGVFVTIKASLAFNTARMAATLSTSTAVALLLLLPKFKLTKTTSLRIQDRPGIQWDVT